MATANQYAADHTTSKVNIDQGQSLKRKRTRSPDMKPGSSTPTALHDRTHPGGGLIHPQQDGDTAQNFVISSTADSFLSNAAVQIGQDEPLRHTTDMITAYEDESRSRSQSSPSVPNATPTASEANGENSLVSKTEPAREHKIEFSIHKGSPSPNSAYSVKHLEETPQAHGMKWVNSRTRTTIFNNAGKKFKLGDIVRISFDKPPSVYGKIVEIRDGSERFAVLQWLYTKSQARELGLSSSAARSWANRIFMFSNHFQIMPGGSISGRAKVNVNSEKYFDARARKILRPLSELQGRLMAQLANAT